MDKHLCAATKLIELLQSNTFSTTLDLDLDSSFTKLVYHRMIPKNNDKTVICHQDKIEVKQEGKKDLTIFARWQDVDTSTLYEVDHSIEKAGKTISNSCNRVYLVFPKSDNFKKHINILHTGIKEDEQIKLVPYSFSFCSNRSNKISA